MSDIWYTVVDNSKKLTQGDILVDLHIPVVNSTTLNESEPELNIHAESVVVMTQACDIENGKVSDIVVCGMQAISEHKQNWISAQEAKAQPTRNEDWKKERNRIRSGQFNNLAMIDKFMSSEVSQDVQIVNFAFLYMLPVEYLEQWISERTDKRLRLKSPYLEYVSQSFARFFMRVGLPARIEFD